MGVFFGFAETLIDTIGLEFSPTATDTERIIAKRYCADRQAKTRLFVFSDDALDSSTSFVQACQAANESHEVSNTGTAALGPAVRRLPGRHLTPVYFKLGLDDLSVDAQDYAREKLGGFESVSFGNEQEVQALVDKVSSFVLGQDPTS